MLRDSSNLITSQFCYVGHRSRKNPKNSRLITAAICCVDCYPQELIFTIERTIERGLVAANAAAIGLAGAMIDARYVDRKSMK